MECARKSAAKVMGAWRCTHKKTKLWVVRKRLQQTNRDFADAFVASLISLIRECVSVMQHIMQ
jgi:hypothetical protein